MEKQNIRLVEEENTIYEIDMDCVKRKESAAREALQREELRKQHWENKRKR